MRITTDEHARANANQYAAACRHQYSCTNCDQYIGTADQYISTADEYTGTSGN